MDKLLNLKEFRKKYKLTQASAAQSIGIDQRQWNRYENGPHDMPTRYLKTLCEAHNVSADWLFGFTDTERNTNDFDTLKNEIRGLIYWAKEQKHISEKAEEILIENIEQIINGIEREGSK